MGFFSRRLMSESGTAVTFFAVGILLISLTLYVSVYLSVQIYSFYYARNTGYLSLATQWGARQLPFRDRALEAARHYLKNHAPFLEERVELRNL